jgi:hypothetical protein
MAAGGATIAPMTWEQLCKLAQELPEVVVDAWYGTPALKVRGKGFVRLKEDGKSVVFMLENLEEQAFLIEEQSDIYYITDHYRGWPTVLARLARLRAPECRMRLERAWRLKAPRALVAAFDGEPTPRAKRPPPRGRSRGGSRPRAR